MQGVLFLRPMLAVARKDVESFLRKNKIAHVEDPTNAGDDFLRNRVRHKLLPFIAEEFSASIKAKLAEVAIIAAVDHDFIDARFAASAAKLLTRTSLGVNIALEGWRKLPQALRRMAICEAGAMVLGREGVITFQHVLMVENAALEGKTCRFPLASGLQAVLSKKILKVIKIS
jgi:tRNA(Ile)-lysidine synthase